MWGVLAYSFVVCLENVIVYPSMWPRLLSMRPAAPLPLGNQTHATTTQDAEIMQLHTALAAAMAAFSAGRAVAALVINLREHGPRSVRVAIVCCFVCSMISALLYLIASTPLELIASRVFGGFGAGALSLMIVVLTEASSSEERTVAFSRFFFCAGLGEIIGPALIAVSTGVRIPINAPPFLELVDEYNVGGVYSAVLFACAFVLVCAGLNSTSRFRCECNSNCLSRRVDGVLILRTRTPSDSLLGDGNGVAAADKAAAVDKAVAEEKGGEDAAIAVGDVDGARAPTSCMRACTIVLILTALLIANVATAAWETSIAIMGVDYFGWNTAEIAYAFIASGAILFVLNVVVIPLLQRGSDVVAKKIRGDRSNSSSSSSGGTANRRGRAARRAIASICVEQKDALWSIGWALCAAGGATLGVLTPFRTQRSGGALRDSLSSIAATQQHQQRPQASLATFVIVQIAYVSGIFALLTHLSSLYTQLAERACSKSMARMIGIMRTLCAAFRVVGNFSVAACAAGGIDNDLWVRVFLLACPVGVLALMLLAAALTHGPRIIAAATCARRGSRTHSVLCIDGRVASLNESTTALDRSERRSEMSRISIFPEGARGDNSSSLSLARVGVGSIAPMDGEQAASSPSSARFERAVAQGRATSSSSMGGLIF